MIAKEKNWFVTVAEVTAILAMSERPARHMPDVDWTVDSEHGRRVRLFTIAPQRKKPSPEPDYRWSLASRTIDSRQRDRPAMAGHMSVEVAELREKLAKAETRAPVAEKTAEQSKRNDWHAQAQEAQKTAAVLAERLKDEQTRLALMATSSGQLQIGPQDGGSNMEHRRDGQSASRETPASRSWQARLTG